MSIRNYKALPLICAACATLAISGCSNEVDDLHAFIEQAKTKHVGTVRPIPQFKPYKNFVYSSADLRDPFVASLETDDQTVSKSSLRPDTLRPREPLENFPLDTLRMVGILEQDNMTWGLIKDPTNVVHRVHEGNYIGQNEGKITTVSETDISLVEIIPDGLGGFIERDASIAIGID